MQDLTATMGRSLCALFLLCFLLFSALSVASAEDLSERESLVSREKQHRHSGFSESECPGACTFRCSKTQYHKPCMFFCQKCCFKCRCVPPGTYAHKEACPCYNNWKTKEGSPKCP